MSRFGAPPSERGYWNRSGRRSGGDPRARIVARVCDEQDPIRSLPCHEGRHKDCDGSCMPFFPNKCECECHPRSGGSETL